MTCVRYANGFVCIPTITKQITHFSKCPTCKKRRKFYGWFQEYYGWHMTCLSCGDQWQDGEMLERPFMPGWRKKNIEYARRKIKEIEK